MDNQKYYGCENPESVSYLEFGSINLVKGEKKIWGYWQDQIAYDLYMFASGSLQVIRQSIQKVPEIKACSIWDV